MSQDLRVLLFSTLFPSAARPLHGVFVQTRLKHLRQDAPVDCRVVAPVPWFPSAAARWGDYARMATTPARELIDGVEVLHPRYLLLPKLGMNLAPLAMAAACLGPLRRLIASGFDFDVIDAHYFYPDGVAAALLARWLGKPLVITARGSDVNLIAQYRWPRHMMLWAAARAGTVIGVSQALVDAIAALGVDRTKLQVVRNGIDLGRFRPLPRAAMRSELGIAGAPVLLSVGNLVDNKGHDLVIDAVASLRTQFPGIVLLIAGVGPELPRLQRQVQSLALGQQVRFAGAVPNAELTRWYSAADALVLASSREGWPNVLLEALASGTPVAATRVGGVPEILAGCAGSRLIDERSAEGITAALRPLLSDPPERGPLRAHAEGFGWAPTSAAQLAIFQRLAGAPASLVPA